MPQYVLLMNWTDQAVLKMQQAAPGELGPDGAEATEIGTLLEVTLKEKLEGTLDAIYWTLGGYDVVAVVTADSDAVVAGLALFLGSKGLVRTQTLRAFGASDMTASPAAGGTVWDAFSRCH